MTKKMMLALFLVVAVASLALAEGPVPKDERKHTSIGKYVTSGQAYEMWKANPEFEARLKSKFGDQDTILVLCRSGHRSVAAVNRMAKAGFVNVYNIVDGFEGDKFTDDESSYKGKRMINGWRNSPVPWTYDLDPALILSAEK
jgi:rhodanese-related sulfurtransferase